MNGLTKWSGKSKDDKGCEFPYRCWQVRDSDHIERKYDCPWYPEALFDSLKDLKSWMSSK